MKVYQLVVNAEARPKNQADITGSNPVLTTNKIIKDMKKLVKDFHKTMIDVCYPIDPFPVYIFLVLALLSPVIVKLLEKS